MIQIYAANFWSKDTSRLKVREWKTYYMQILTETEMGSYTNIRVSRFLVKKSYKRQKMIMGIDRSANTWRRCDNWKHMPEEDSGKMATWKAWETLSLPRQ